MYIDPTLRGKHYWWHGYFKSTATQLNEDIVRFVEYKQGVCLFWLYPAGSISAILRIPVEDDTSIVPVVCEARS